MSRSCGNINTLSTLSTKIKTIKRYAILIPSIFYYYIRLKIKNFTKWFREKKKSFLSFDFKIRSERRIIDKQTIIVNHIIAIKPQLDKLLEEVFVNYPIKDYLVLKNSGITNISVESKEFKIIVEKFIDNFKRVIGKRPFEEIESYWGKEEFTEYVILWLYFRILKELQMNILKLIES